MVGIIPEHYQRESGEPAVRSVIETRSDHDTEWSAIRQEATRLDFGPETLRELVCKAVVSAGLRAGFN